MTIFFSFMHSSSMVNLEAAMVGDMCVFMQLLVSYIQIMTHPESPPFTPPLPTAPIIHQLAVVYTDA